MLEVTGVVEIESVDLREVAHARVVDRAQFHLRKRVRRQHSPSDGLGERRLQRRQVAIDRAGSRALLQAPRAPLVDDQALRSLRGLSSQSANTPLIRCAARAPLFWFADAHGSYSLSMKSRGVEIFGRLLALSGIPCFAASVRISSAWVRAISAVKAGCFPIDLDVVRGHWTW